MMPVKDGYQIAEEIRGSSTCPYSSSRPRAGEDTLQGWWVRMIMRSPSRWTSSRPASRPSWSAALPDTEDEVGEMTIGLYTYDYNRQELRNGDEAQR